MSLKRQPANKKMDYEVQFFNQLSSERALSNHTIATYRNALKVFKTWRKKADLLDSSMREVQDFIIEMQRTRSRTTIHNYISALRTFFRFAVRERLIQQSPTDGLILPKLQKLLPKILTITQIKALINAPMQALQSELVTQYIALRDSMIIELFYGTGMRISELQRIRLSDIDFSNRTVRVLGKGSKERICPFSLAAEQAIMRYREICSLSPDDYLLAHGRGAVLSIREIQYRIKFYLKFCGLPLDLSPHTIRHAYATHLLNAGADLRLVQELLGHANLETTQIYTHVDSTHMKNVYLHCHPHA